MKQAMIALGCVLALGLAAGRAQATALTTSSPQYLGYIVPGLPSGAANEAAFIDALAGLATGGSVTPCGSGTGSTDNTCYRSSNTFTSLPAANFVDKPTGTGQTTIDISGYAYLLAKYGAGQSGNASHVWVVRDLDGNVTVPGTIGESGGVSHMSRFNYDPGDRVPDGGTTLMLLGTALVGLGALRRRF